MPHKLFTSTTQWGWTRPPGTPAHLIQDQPASPHSGTKHLVGYGHDDHIAVGADRDGLRRWDPTIDGNCLVAASSRPALCVGANGVAPDQAVCRVPPELIMEQASVRPSHVPIVVATSLMRARVNADVVRCRVRTSNIDGDGGGSLHAGLVAEIQNGICDRARGRIRGIDIEGTGHVPVCVSARLRMFEAVGFGPVGLPSRLDVDQGTPSPAGRF